MLYAYVQKIDVTSTAQIFFKLNAASSSFLQSSGRLRIHPGTALFHPSLPTALLLYLPF